MRDTAAGASSASAEPSGEVTLDGSGSPPRAPLRHRLEAGATARWKLVVQTLVQVDDAPPETSELALEVHATVSSVTDRHAAVTLTLAELAPLAEPVAAAAWRSLEGQRAVVTLDPRGRIGGGPRTAATPDDLTARQLWASLVEGLHEAWLPFPEDPVGVGARWTSRRDLVRGGVRLRRTTRFHLRRRDEEVGIEAELVEVPIAGAHADPSLGGVVALEAVAGSGVGRRTWVATSSGTFARRADSEIATDLTVRARLLPATGADPEDRVVRTTQAVSVIAVEGLDRAANAGENAP